MSSVVNSPDSPSAPAAPVRLALVDDSELVRVGLRTLLGLHKQHIEIVAEAANVAEALAKVAAPPPPPRRHHQHPAPPTPGG